MPILPSNPTLTHSLYPHHESQISTFDNSPDNGIAPQQYTSIYEMPPVSTSVQYSQPNIYQSPYTTSPPHSPSNITSSIKSSITNISNAFSRFDDKDKTNVFFRAGYDSIFFTIIVWVARFVTGFLCTPFVDLWYFRKYAASIRFNGHRIKLRASILDFIVLQVVHYVCMGATGGLYLLVMDRVTAAFVDSRLEWDLEYTPLDAPNKDFRISGRKARFRFFGARPWFFWDALFYLGLIFTLGLGYPWLTQMYYKRWFKNARVDGNRMEFRGKGMDFLWLYVHSYIMTVITLGLYKWLGCWDREMNRYLDTKIGWY